jgi:F-box/WD-40 domain protein MET30
MQYSDNLSHPSFPVLITGSYDRTARVWNLDTGKEIRVLHGHGRAVRALQFDEAKLVTGSMDRTLKVWNWRTGACIRTLEGHSDGIVCLNFDSNVLASGSVDTTIKIWNFRNGECFTLRGHHDWVNSLQLWNDPARTPIPAQSTDNMMDITEPRQPDIDPGKMLFSASDDGTIKLWDLTLRTCVRAFTGHVGQVQAIKLAPAECDRERERAPMSAVSPPSPDTFASRLSKVDQEDSLVDDPSTMTPKQSPETVLFSGSLDNTIKVWDIASGKATSTMFGHIEGVWSIAYDRLRIVSGSHDRTIKVWNREDGKCVTTLVGHRAAVTCLALGDDKIVSGSDDGDIRVWSFAPSPPQPVL